MTEEEEETPKGDETDLKKENGLPDTDGDATLVANIEASSAVDSERGRTLSYSSLERGL